MQIMRCELYKYRFLMTPRLDKKQLNILNQGRLVVPI